MAFLYDTSSLYIFHISKEPFKTLIFSSFIVSVYYILKCVGPDRIRERPWLFLFLLIPLLVFFGTLPWNRRMPLLHLGLLGVYIIFFFGYLESLENGEEDMEELREEIGDLLPV
jgi:hypothetical protein